MSWAEIARRLAHHFPKLTDIQIYEKVRYPFRKKGRLRGLISDEQAVAESKTYENNKKIEYKSDGSVTFEGIVELMEGEPITPEIIMRGHNLKAEEWKVITYKTNFWQAQQKGGGTMLLYQSKITVKPKADGISLKEIDEHFRKLERQNVTYPNTIARQAECMTEINIADLHLGKLCWQGNTGNNYDYKIARDMYYSLLSEICGEVKSKSNEYITFVWSNDFFNADTIANTTTGLTPQECDVRWQKMFNIGVEMLVKGIEYILQECKTPIKIFYTPSNHDEVNGYHALKYLEAWFRGCNSVEIDISAYPRKYIRFGNILLGYSHGSKENSKGSKDKASRLASLMPIEVPELWSKSKTREYHIAHLHSEQMIQEINGVIVRRISSPTASDSYHVENGYAGAVRKAQTFIYDKQDGLIQIINTPVRS